MIEGDFLLNEKGVTVAYRDPVRQDYPSLSSFYRYALCPISYKLSLQAPADKPSKYSVSGTAGHLALATKDTALEGFSRDEIDTVEACREQELELVESIANAPISEEIREVRLWYLELGERVYSGQMDVIYLLDDKWRTSVSFDYKLGWLQVPPPSVNLQLRGGSLIAWQNHGSRRSFSSIIQPRVARWSTPVLYEIEDLQQSRGQIQNLMASIHSPSAPANPSAEACRHCPAKLICKAAYHPSHHIAARKEELIVAMDDAELSRFGELVEQATLIIKAAWDELKVRVTERPDDFPDWRMQSTGYSTKLTDVHATFAAVSDLLSDDPIQRKLLFAEVLDASVPQLANLAREHDKSLTKKSAAAHQEN